MSQTPWWKGTRGEWYVVAQVVLFVLVLFGPRTWLGWPTWTFPNTQLGSIGSGVLLLVGGFLVVAGIFGLGANLTAVPTLKNKQRWLKRVHISSCAIQCTAVGFLWPLVGLSGFTAG